MAAGLGAACSLRPLSELSDATDLVLLAPGEPASADAPVLAGAVAEARSRGVPSVLWATSDVSRLEPVQALADACDQVVVADPAARTAFPARPDLPAVLQLAADAPGAQAELDLAAPRRGVLYAGGYDASWPAADRRVLDMLLDGAAASGHELEIVIPPDAPAAFPARFASRVRTAARRDRLEAIARAAVVLAFSPGVESRHLVPRLAFQAVAVGTPVVAFANSGVRHHLGEASVLVSSVEQATAAVDDLGARDAALVDRLAHWREVVLRGHTYRHRLASLASLAGIRAVP